MLTEFHPSAKVLLGLVVMPFSHRKVQVLNIQGHPEEFKVAIPFSPPGQVGAAIPPNEIINGSETMTVYTS